MPSLTVGVVETWQTVSASADSECEWSVDGECHLLSVNMIVSVVSVSEGECRECQCE
jgi:hypothetical protein